MIPGPVSSSVRSPSLLPTRRLLLQVLLWIAFVKLPFAGKFNPVTSKIHHDRGNALWHEAMEWAKARRSKNKVRGRRSNAGRARRTRCRRMLC
jgi:hypothetical protein